MDDPPLTDEERARQFAEFIGFRIAGDPPLDALGNPIDTRSRKLIRAVNLPEIGD